jgi:hypothetical protein
LKTKTTFSISGEDAENKKTHLGTRIIVCSQNPSLRDRIERSLKDNAAAAWLVSPTGRLYTEHVLNSVPILSIAYGKSLF